MGNRRGNGRGAAVAEGAVNENERVVEDKKKPQATLPGRLVPVPMSFRLAHSHHTDTVEAFQLLPAGPLACPLSSIAWSNE